MVVNTLVVMEIAYLFSVRYVHGTSLTLAGVVGTPAVLIGVGTVAVAQLAFTYLPVSQHLFGARPLTVLAGGNRARHRRPSCSSSWRSRSR